MSRREASKEQDEEEPQVFDGDEEIDSDDAFNSEDERKYGYAFKKDAPPGYGESSQSDSSGSEGSDDDDYDGVVSVLDMIEKREAKASTSLKKGAKSDQHDKKVKERNDSSNESDPSDDEDPNLGDHEAFLRHVESMAASKRKSTSSPLSNNSSNGTGSELTAEDLLSSLQSNASVEKLKKHVERIENDAKTAKAPTARVVRKREERKLGYVQSKQDATDWTALVKKNREAEHVVFQSDMPDRVAVTTSDIVHKFTPSTDMEKQINDLLTNSGMDESSIRETEDRELALNTLTEEEVALRRSQLAKMRALLFYQEQKSKRVKKIKSKLYRKIRRKARDKHENERREQLRASDPELARQLDEEDAKRRAKERFTLRHKNMSRWAKTALKHGQVHAPGTKEAIEESLRIGQELKRKMQARKAAGGSSSDDSYFSDSDSGSGSEEDDDGGSSSSGGIVFRDQPGSSSGGTGSSKHHASAARKARKLVAQIEDDQHKEKSGSLLSQKKGLMSLKFMQNALSRQREKARAEALELLAELEENGGERVDDGTEREQRDGSSRHKSKGKSTGRRIIGGESSTKVDLKSRENKNGVRPDMSARNTAKDKSNREVVSSSVRFSGGVRTQMSGAVEIPSSEILLRPSNDVHDQRPEDDSTKLDKKIVMKKEESWGGNVDRWDGSDDTWSSLPELNTTKQSSKDNVEKPSRHFGEEHSKETIPEDLPDVDNFSYRELQAELRKRGKKASGKKLSLINKLKAALLEESAEKVKSSPQAHSTPTNSVGDGTHNNDDEDDDEDDDAGGWLPSSSAESSESSTATESSKKGSSKKVGSKSRTKLDVDTALSSISKDSQQSRSTQDDLQRKNSSSRDRQNELVQMAFAVDNNAEADFAAEKAAVLGEHENGGKKPEPALAGWGSWTGSGVLESFPKGQKGRRKKLNHGSKRKRGDDSKPVAKRRDANLKHVIINEKRNKRAAKFLVAKAPHQFDNREQYERSIRNPVGPEWNTSDSHAQMTRPKMIIRGGNVIAPIKMPHMYKRKLSTINREFEAAQKAKRAKRSKNRHFKQ